MKNIDNGIILHYLTVLILLLIEGGQCIHLENVVVPRYKLKGQNAELDCGFNLENDTLYAVKWYFDESEFYRYLPENTPPKVVFNMSGITVNVTLSDHRKVFLEDLNMNSSGIYRCEVSAEAPTFATVSGEGKLEVMSLTEGGPFISGADNVYKMGDDLYLNCTSTPTLPEAKVIWYVNDFTVEYLSLERNRTLFLDPKTDLVYWWSRIRIPLTQELFSKGPIIIVSCTAQMSPTQWKGREKKELPLLEIKEAKIFIVRSNVTNTSEDDNDFAVTISCSNDERSNQTTEPITTTMETVFSENLKGSKITCEGRKVMTLFS